MRNEAQELEKLLNACCADSPGISTVQVAVPLLVDTARGMRFLHSAVPPLVHGDLKARNVLVDGNLRAKVCGGAENPYLSLISLFSLFLSFSVSLSHLHGTLNVLVEDKLLADAGCRLKILSFPPPLSSRSLTHFAPYLLSHSPSLNFVHAHSHSLHNFFPISAVALPIPAVALVLHSYRSHPVML
jgi:serine/threonine protein kinase